MFTMTAEAFKKEAEKFAGILHAITSPYPVADGGASGCILTKTNPLTHEAICAVFNGHDAIDYLEDMEERDVDVVCGLDELAETVAMFDQYFEACERYAHPHLVEFGMHTKRDLKASFMPDPWQPTRPIICVREEIEPIEYTETGIAPWEYRTK